MSVDTAGHDEESMQVSDGDSGWSGFTECRRELLDDAGCDQDVDCQERTVGLCYLCILEELLHGKPPLDEQADNFESLDVDKPEICDLELWNNWKSHECQCHERIIQRAPCRDARGLSQIIQTGCNLRYGQVGHETTIGERKRTNNVSVVCHREAATDEGDLLYCQQHVAVSDAAHDDIVGILSL